MFREAPGEYVFAMKVLHATWWDGGLRIWAETVRDSALPTGDRAHPFSMTPDELRGEIDAILKEPAAFEPCGFSLALPAIKGRPLASTEFAHHNPDDPDLAGDEPGIERFTVDALSLSPTHIERVLETLETVRVSAKDGFFAGNGDSPELAIGESIRFFALAARYAHSLVAQQQFVPALNQTAGGEISASWQPWLGDERNVEDINILANAMPAVARAGVDDHEHSISLVLGDFLAGIVDHRARASLAQESMFEAIEDWQPEEDSQVAWLTGLLNGSPDIPKAPLEPLKLYKSVRGWIGSLEERGTVGDWVLCLVIEEPLDIEDNTLAPDPDIPNWLLSFHLRSIERPNILLSAEDVWSLNRDSASIEGQLIESPQELLLSELSRAARVYRTLETALEQTTPAELDLSTKEAYRFMREFRPLLSDQGISIVVPEWWDSPGVRLGARLKISSEDAPDADPAAPNLGTTGAAHLGLNSLVSYEWSLAIGETPLTLEQFKKLAEQKSPLVRIDGQWVEVRPEDIKTAMEFVGDNPSGEVSVAQALRMAYGLGWKSDAKVPILGLDATGWIAGLLEASQDPSKMPIIDTPKGFKGELRPYQQRGLSWLVFLDRLGLGPCLADDMGLGKTIQLLTLLLHEREIATEGQHPEPTLLVVPMSIVGNWRREAERFAPSLNVMIHHGVERRQGESFVESVAKADMVITTYALVNRDTESIGSVKWGRVVLDEAQNIKNPTAKQSKAVRALDSPRRITLTGTPLENRLSELWSILDFCNPGLLGSLGEFKRSFSIPIERHRDRERATQLRSLVRPFILRRLKTDPLVISDLPEKIESKEYCRLTPEQASLYENCVKEMLTEVERKDGIARKGVVLRSLTRLKQICNHPILLEKDKKLHTNPAIARSGKCIRLIEMLDEVLAAKDGALIFTQFRTMSEVLAKMLRHTLDTDVLLLHGGTPQKTREALIERFQKADGTAPIFVLSLKAGGFGLNLTAASHVFHFDRWWNPAVENQATDRAYRIGQNKTVLVHKFIVSGTLEERIDKMIESKTALAEDVIGSGEDWLTELSLAQLSEMLALRPDALTDD